MSKMKPLADYLHNNPVDAVLFAEVLTCIRDDIVQDVLKRNIKDGYKAGDTHKLPWETILEDIATGLIARKDHDEFVDEVLTERRELGIKPGFFDKLLSTDV